jgi:hypothetical protein
MLPAGFRFQRQLRLVPTHHHHLIIDGPFILASRYPSPSYLNVGRFTALTHHVYNLFPSPFLLFAYPHCKITHLYHELYSILANSCFRYNRGKVYSPRICFFTTFVCHYVACVWLQMRKSVHRSQQQSKNKQSSKSHTRKGSPTLGSMCGSTQKSSFQLEVFGRIVLDP